MIYRLVTSPTHGSLTGAGTDWVYTPNTNFVGVETFTFTAKDDHVDAPVATVTINVLAGPAEASIAGLVFDDRNANGQPDANETGITGLLVTLTPANPQAVATRANFTTTTDSIGAWRLDGVPFGQYTLQVASSGAVQVRTPVTTAITLSQRGVQQTQPTSVQVRERSLFIPLVIR